MYQKNYTNNFNNRRLIAETKGFGPKPTVEKHSLSRQFGGMISEEIDQSLDNYSNTAKVIFEANKSSLTKNNLEYVDLLLVFLFSSGTSQIKDFFNDSNLDIPKIKNWARILYRDFNENGYSLKEKEYLELFAGLPIGQTFDEFVNQKNIEFGNVVDQDSESEIIIDLTQILKYVEIKDKNATNRLIHRTIYDLRIYNKFYPNSPITTKISKALVCTYFSMTVEALIKENKTATTLFQINKLIEKATNLTAEKKKALDNIDMTYKYILGDGYLLVPKNQADYDRLFGEMQSVELAFPGYFGGEVEEEKKEKSLEDKKTTAEIIKVIENFIDIYFPDKGINPLEDDLNRKIIIAMILNWDGKSDKANLRYANDFWEIVKLIKQNKTISKRLLADVKFRIRTGLTQSQAELQKILEQQNSDELTADQLEKLNNLQDLTREELILATSEAYNLHKNSTFKVQFTDLDLKLSLAVIIFGDRLQEVNDMILKKDERYEAKLTKILQDIDRLGDGPIRIIRKLRVGFRKEESENSVEIHDGYIIQEEKGRFWGIGEDPVEINPTAKKTKTNSKTKSEFVGESGNMINTAENEEYITSIRDVMVLNKIQAKEIHYAQDGVTVFVKDNMILIIKKGGILQVIYEPSMELEMMEELVNQDLRGKLNSVDMEAFCVYNSYRYFTRMHKGMSIGEGVHTDQNWKDVQVEIIINPNEFVGWKINLSQKYPRNDLNDLLLAGINYKGISSIDNLIKDYKRMMSVNVGTGMILDFQKAEQIMEVITFKKDSDSDNTQKVNALKKLLGILIKGEIIDNELINEYVANLKNWFEWLEELFIFYENALNECGRRDYPKLHEVLSTLDRTLKRSNAYISEKRIALGKEIFGDYGDIFESIAVLESIVRSLHDQLVIQTKFESEKSKISNQKRSIL